MSHHIPLELIQKIIQYLKDDTETLRSCSVVCSSWTHFSQEILFKTFSIDESEDPASSCPKFLALLETSPHLACYVRYLEITFGDVFPYDGESTINDVASILPPLFSRFSNVRQLHMSLYVREWIKLPSTLLPALMPLLPNLRTLIIQNGSFSKNGLELVHLLSHCTSQLRVLKLVGIALRRHLEIDASYASAQAVLSGLEELWLGFDDSSVGSFVKETIQAPNLSRYLRQCLASNVIETSSSRFGLPFAAPNIERLGISLAFDRGTFHPSDVPCFHEFHNVNVLDFSLFANVNDGPQLFESFLGDTIHAMSPQAVPHLVELSVTVYLPANRGPLAPQIWERIGVALIKLVISAELRRAVIKLKGEADDPLEASSQSQRFIDGAKAICGDLLDLRILVIKPNINVKARV